MRAILNWRQVKSRSVQKRVLAAVAALFTLYQLPLEKIRADLFRKLRNERWNTSDENYMASFEVEEENARHPEESLQASGDMGYSGSTFYETSDSKFIVKSIPRYFEHSFFRDDLMLPYIDHMSAHPKSMLVRICDFLAGPYFTIGSLLGLAPTHHIIMENILYGQSEAKELGGPKWEYWDLKPTSYFYPERDIAQGSLTSDATKDRLADKFEDKMVLSREQARDFMLILEEDTQLLADCNAVDYSLFLVRIAIESQNPFHDHASSALGVLPNDPPFIPPSPPTWRTGVKSADGKHVFRASILDFFWAKHKAQPQFMTGLIKLYNKVDRQGPMSITTHPAEYRARFLKMVENMIDIRK